MRELGDMIAQPKTLKAALDSARLTGDVRSELIIKKVIATGKPDYQTIEKWLTSVPDRRKKTARL